MNQTKELRALLLVACSAPILKPLIKLCVRLLKSNRTMRVHKMTERVFGVIL